MEKTLYFTHSSGAVSYARNGGGGSGLYVKLPKSTTATWYFGVNADSNGYSSASEITNVSISYQAKMTDGDGEGAWNPDKVKTNCRAIVGNTEGDNPLFVMSQNDSSTIESCSININDTTTCGSVGGTKTGTQGHTKWEDVSSGTSPSSTRTVANTMLGAIVYGINTRTNGNGRVYLDDVAVTYTLNIRNRVSFYNGSSLINTSVVSKDAIPTPPSISTIGKTLVGWRQGSVSGQLYTLDTPLPACDGYDVAYYAEWEDNTYYVNTYAYNENDSDIGAPNGLTPDTTYVINGNSITVEASSSDYDINNDGSEIYVFDHWVILDSSDNAISGTASGNSYTIGALTASNIPTWFANGDTLTAIAYYKRAYDITVTVDGADAKYDPTGVGRNGISSLSVYDMDDILVASLDEEHLLSDTASDRVIRLYTDRVKFDVTLEDATQYFLYGKTFEEGDVSRDTETDVCTLLTSTLPMWLTVYKKFFSITLTGNIDNAVKAYDMSTGVGVAISPNNIPWGTPVVIDARATATIDTKYDATLYDTNDNAIAGNKYDILRTDELYGVVQDYSFNVTTTAITYQITTTIKVNGVEPGSSTTIDVDKSSAYTFTASAPEGQRIVSAVIQMNGQTQYTLPQGDTSVLYTIPHVTANCTFVIQRYTDPHAVVTLKFNSNHGNVVYDGEDVVARTSFIGFTILSVAANARYEIDTITYQWTHDYSPVQGQSGTVVFGTPIQYSGTMPSDKEVACVITVTYKRNALYYSTLNNNDRTVSRPSSLYYTANGGTPQEVIAVFGQSRDCPYPVLLYGFEEQWVIIDVVTQNLFYSLDLLTGELSIFGTGDLIISNTVPWINYIDFVRHVSIADTCTSIPAGLFANHPYLTDISLPTSLVNGSYPYADIEGERLVMYCLGSDDADNYTFEIDDERLVISYVDGD